MVLSFIFDVRLGSISTLSSERISGSVDDLFGRKSVIKNVPLIILFRNRILIH